MDKYMHTYKHSMLVYHICNNAYIPMIHTKLYVNAKSNDF